MAGSLAQAAPLGTAFTYQGRLQVGNTPATGSHDLVFAIYDGASEGLIVGGPITNAATPVSNGLFTVTLDFGPGVFAGPARWLEIAVRTNGGGNFSLLTPRQPLTATPYAQYAPSAGTAALANTLPPGTITAAMLTDGAVTSPKIGAAAVKPSHIDDGGNAVYEAFLETTRALDSHASPPLSVLSLIGGTAPSLTFTLDGNALGTVVGFTGHEEMSAPYVFVVSMLLSNASLIPDEQLGRLGRLTYARNSRTTRFGGLVTGCSVSSHDGSNTLYTFRLESPLACLALTTNYRIRQNVSVPDVAASLYATAPAASLETALTTTYATREALIQYAESDLNCFSRLLEEEGIFYFFRQEGTSPPLVLGDSPAALLPAPYTALRYYSDGHTNIPTADYVRAFQKAARESTQKTTLNAYNFKNPRSSLLASFTSAAGFGEFYEFGTAVSPLSAVARRRQERQELERATLFGSGTAADLRPGHTFTLDDRSGAGLGNSYLVTAVRHAAFRRITNGVSTLHYGNQFEVIPAALPFRPALKTPKPLAQPASAVVTGPASEQTHVDSYGRVKVQFHWDRYGTTDENSSAWLRVASPLAGPDRGLMFLPRIGDEVLVTFIQGDPDQPVVSGSFYNGMAMPPASLPANKTMSTIKPSSGNGANEIRFEDKPGQEQLSITATKDFQLQAGNHALLSAGGNLLLSSGQGTVLNTAGDPNTALTVGGTVAATAFRGGGAALTNLAATALTGTLNDGRLSPNIPRLNGNQTFTGNNAFTGPLGLGTATPQDALLDVEGHMRLNDFDLFFRAGTDRAHGVGWRGDVKPFAGINPDGPVLFGCAGGGLGTACNGEKLALQWDWHGRVTLDPQNQNAGTLSSHALVFGSARAEGIVSARSGGGNLNGLDFFTAGTNRLSVTALGRVGIGTSAPARQLHVADGTGPSGHGGSIQIGSLVASADPKLIHFGDLQGSGLGYVYLGERGQDDTLELRASRFYFNAGNVGIGITNPLAPLEVSGTVKATRFQGDGAGLTGLSGVVTWQMVTNASQATLANHGYVANRATTVSFTLPTGATLGDTLRLTGLGAGGWILEAGTNRVVGVGGVFGGGQYQSMELLCVGGGDWLILSHFSF